MAARCSDHWRKNLPVVGQQNRAFAIDLVGYGYSDKPDPRRGDCRLVLAGHGCVSTQCNHTAKWHHTRPCAMLAMMHAVQALPGADLVYFRELGPAAAGLHRTEDWRTHIPLVQFSRRWFLTPLRNVDDGDTCGCGVSLGSCDVCVGSIWFCMHSMSCCETEQTANRLDHSVMLHAAGLASLQAAIERPQAILAVFLTNISLRKLHAANQSR